MIPAHAATQNTRRPAMSRSYSGLGARRSRNAKPAKAAAATAARPSVSVPLFGTGAKLIARISAATRTTERIPPRLSTGSVASLTWAGTNFAAIGRATATRGSVMTNTDPHENCSSSAPATRGPSEAIAPPSADQSAIDFVRAAPDHSAVISASVVGYAIPAESPPSTRAPKSTPSLGANVASRQAGTDSAMPRRSINLRP
jgi:hypothetical protein